MDYWSWTIASCWLWITGDHGRKPDIVMDRRQSLKIHHSSQSMRPIMEDCGWPRRFFSQGQSLGQALVKSDLKEVSISFCFGFKILTIPHLPVYNAHFFLTNFASKIEMYIIHGTFCFHEVIYCITSQKVQSQRTPNFMQPVEINQDKKFV